MSVSKIMKPLLKISCNRKNSHPFINLSFTMQSRLEELSYPNNISKFHLEIGPKNLASNSRKSNDFN